MPATGVSKKSLVCQIGQEMQTARERSIAFVVNVAWTGSELKQMKRTAYVEDCSPTERESTIEMASSQIDGFPRC